MSNEKPTGIAYPPRPLAEPRSGRYAGCKRVAVRYSAAYPMGRERIADYKRIHFAVMAIESGARKLGMAGVYE